MVGNIIVFLGVVGLFLAVLSIAVRFVNPLSKLYDKFDACMEKLIKRILEV